MNTILKNVCVLPLVLVLLNACVSPSTPQRSTAQAGEGVCQNNYPSDSFENGFIVLDVLEPKRFGNKEEKIVNPIMCQKDMDKVRELGLQPYSPMFKFGKKAKAKDSVEPWLNKQLDVTKKEDAEKVASILQRYVLEGWFENDKTNSKKNSETHFRENNIRTWCNTPWLNVTEKGREAIHGLTKEFPIRTTSVYTVPADIEKSEDAVTWGIAYFNKPVCDGYVKFFDQQDMIRQMRDNAPNFVGGDGAVSFKLLFNAMKDWRVHMKGQWTSDKLEAYNWWAHVSHARQDDNYNNGDESIRELMNVAHVQMDISLSDKRLKGTNPVLKNWIMTTYYFDPNYTNPYLADMDIPEALKHMRPVGLQYGLNAGETHIFDGSDNNHRPGKFNGGDGTELPYTQTRLNGPVDNIEGSCLGCHAASGMRFNPAPMAETKKPRPQQDRSQFPPMTFMTQKSYVDYISGKGRSGSFDFNMQLDKAMRNFVNSKGEKIHPEAQK